MDHHRLLLDEYLHFPGHSYQSQSQPSSQLHHLGNGYVTLRMRDDVTRPEIGEFLLARGWKMIGFSTKMVSGKCIAMEKWCNIRDH